MPNRQRFSWSSGFVSAVILGIAWAQASAAAPAVESVGQRLYEKGILSSGKPLTGTRINAPIAPGQASACATCHRPSGMGSVEADVIAPPITGRALFAHDDQVIATMDPRTGKAFNQAHEPYTEQQVATMLQTGRYPDGRQMNAVMPRYDLSKADMDALIAHLKTLSTEWSPGVTADQIRLATIVTPDVSPERKKLFLSMANAIITQKNGSTKVAKAGSASRHHMTSAAELVLGTERTWALDVWELKGAPETWAKQLDAYYAAAPVFAIASGVGNTDWSPVSEFCDRMTIPCWFPSAPVGAPDSRYTLHFHSGVTLEAQVLAKNWRQASQKAPRRVIQVVTGDGVGRAASAALREGLRGAATTVVDRTLADPSKPEQWAAALKDVAATDAVVVWTGSLQSMPALKDTGFTQYYVSGVLGAADSATLPVDARHSVHIVYPYELPEQRAPNVAYFKAWLVQRRIPLVNEIWQSEVFFSFSFLTDTVSEMLDNLYRDYLIERAEMMIDRREATRAESEYLNVNTSHVRLHADASKDADVLARGPEALRAIRAAAAPGFLQRSGTTVYPHLMLGAGQRFASKGAYLVHFDPSGRVQADSEWIVP